MLMFEKLTDEQLISYKKNLENQISRYDNLQLAKKVCL